MTVERGDEIREAAERDLFVDQELEDAVREAAEAERAERDDEYFQDVIRDAAQELYNREQEDIPDGVEEIRAEINRRKAAENAQRLAELDAIFRELGRDADTDTDQGEKDG